jgi:asparagine synthase (glutamine-hydrolysing)
MNLFVIGWNCSTEQRAVAFEALREMHSIFPLLDLGSVSTWAGEKAFAAWMHTAAETALPRRYIHRLDDELVLFDGTAVDSRGHISAHDAAQLGAQWDSLPERLEGQFVVARIKRRPETLELLNDPFGVLPVYVYEGGSYCLISNSARLLARIAGIASLDEEAVAMQLQMDSPPGDRSLIRGISVIPAGQCWRWAESVKPTRNTYAPAAELASLPKRSFGPSQANALADALGDVLSFLVRDLGDPQCPITAGRDSRMMVGLLMARGLSADHFTEGEADDIDMQVGSSIADRFRLPHRKSPGAAEALARAWDEVCLRVVQQHDGHVTLMHARNALERPERLDRIPIHLYGAGGEHARGNYFSLPFILKRPNLADAITETSKHFGRRKPLLRPVAQQMALDEIGNGCRSLHEQGFAPVDIPDAFDLTQENRRWAGAQSRQGAEHIGAFSPFLTRPYVHAAFATPPIERLQERIPYQLIAHLSTELRAMPLDKPWPAQTLNGLIFQYLASQYKRLERRLKQPADAVGRTRDRLLILDQLIQRSRERYLDRSNSSIWRLVDRAGFESVTSDRASPSERMRNMASIYWIATMFEFEEDLAAWVRRPFSGNEHRAMLATPKTIRQENQLKNLRTAGVLLQSP